MHQSKHTTAYSQNELINTGLIRSLVERAGIRRGDTVYDIGTGSGNISRALLETGARVIGIENDPVKYRKCREKFLTEDRFELFLDDFLQHPFLPNRNGDRYKVFANIPFVHTAAILAKLLYREHPPEDCYLVMQKEAGEKYAGTFGETLQSLLLKPLFWVEIVHHFNRNDFFPVPGADIVLIQFERRRYRLVSAEYYGLYRDFIVFCREVSGKTVKYPLTRLFSRQQLSRLSRLVDINFRADPTHLTFYQFITLFQFYLRFYRKGQAGSVAGTWEAFRKK